MKSLLSCLSSTTRSLLYKEADDCEHMRLNNSIAERNRGYSPNMRATWKPHEKHGHLTTQSDLPDSVYAFPKQRKEPLTDARHVRNAIARFDQVEGVTKAERDLALANIRKAAKYYDIELTAEPAAH